MTRALALVLLCAACAACATTSERATEVSGGVPDDAPAIVKALGADVGVYAFADWTTYPDAAAGWSVRYVRGEEGWADLFVYPLPRHLVDRGPDERAALELRQAVGDIEALVGARGFQSMKVVGEGVFEKGGRYVGFAEMRVVMDGIPARSYALVLALDDVMLKVRATDIGADGKRIRRQVLALAEAFFDAAGGAPVSRRAPIEL